MTASQPKPRVLKIPKVRYPYYWEFQVSKSCVSVRLCRRPFGLFRNAILPKASDHVLYREGKFLSHGFLDEIEMAADAIHTDVVGRAAERFAVHVPSHVKVTTRR